MTKPSVDSDIASIFPAVNSSSFRADSWATARKTPDPTKQAREKSFAAISIAASRAFSRNRSPTCCRRGKVFHTPREKTHARDSVRQSPCWNRNWSSPVRDRWPSRPGRARRCGPGLSARRRHPAVFVAGNQHVPNPRILLDCGFQHGQPLRTVSRSGKTKPTTYGRSGRTNHQGWSAGRCLEPPILRISTAPHQIHQRTADVVRGARAHQKHGGADWSFSSAPIATRRNSTQVGPQGGTNLIRLPPRRRLMEDLLRSVTGCHGILFLPRYAE